MSVSLKIGRLYRKDQRSKLCVLQWDVAQIHTWQPTPASETRSRHERIAGGDYHYFFREQIDNSNKSKPSSKQHQRISHDKSSLAVGERSKNMTSRNSLGILDIKKGEREEEKVLQERAEQALSNPSLRIFIQMFVPSHVAEDEPPWVGSECRRDCHYSLLVEARSSISPAISAVRAIFRVAWTGAEPSSISYPITDGIIDIIATGIGVPARIVHSRAVGSSLAPGALSRPDEPGVIQGGSPCSVSRAS
jgi:hypothetical protein